MKKLLELLDHFAKKLPKTVETERMLRMLTAAQKNLVSNVQMNAIATVTENIGASCKIRDLQRRFAKVLQGLTPALIAMRSS